MKIRCFAISAVDSESVSNFLTRVAQEVLALEEASKKVNNVVLNFPTKVNQDKQVQAVVFFTSESMDMGHDMDYAEFQSDPQDTAVAAFEHNLEQVKEWLAQQKELEIYDISTQAVLNRSGEDVIHTILYYGSSKS